jgi:antitoxin component YwqK of YwqJK toxin-antitoxin module
MVLPGCRSKTHEVQPVLPMYNAATVQITMQQGLAFYQGRPFTGMLYTLAANNDTIQVTGFNQGKEHGTWRSFYPSNRLQEKRYYHNGQKTGKYIAYWPNGKQKWLYHFNRNEYHGQCLEWNDKGLLVKNMNFNMGYEDGPQHQWYDNGKVKANYLMINGRRYGLLGTKNCVNVSDSIFKY